MEILHKPHELDELRDHVLFGRGKPAAYHLFIASMLQHRLHLRIQLHGREVA